MIVEIRLVARLLRIPLLRVEGVVAIRDVDGVGPGGASIPADDGARSPLGRDLAVAQAIMAELEASRDDRR